MLLDLMNPAILSKLAKLSSEFGDLKAADLQATHLVKLASAVDFDVSEQLMQKLLDTARAEKPGVSAVQWAVDLFQSGRLTQLSGEDGVATILDRCAFCHQPNTVQKPPQGESIHYRCAFCEQPNTIRPL